MTQQEVAPIHGAAFVFCISLIHIKKHLTIILNPNYL